MDRHWLTSAILPNRPESDMQEENPSVYLPTSPPRRQANEDTNDAQARTNHHRLTQTSSVYEDDVEWNHRLSRLSIRPASLEFHDPDVLAVPYGLIDDLCDGFADPSIVEKGFGGDQRPIEINRDLRTRNLCIAMLALGIMIGITSFVLGCRLVTSGKVLLPDFLKGTVISMETMDYPFPDRPSVKHYITGHRIFSVPEPAMLLIGLVLNISLTIIFDGMNFIQISTLRWSLCKEGRLVFNSNPRLFVGARHFAPNWRITNFVSSVTLVVGYGSISVLTTAIYIIGPSTMNGYLDTSQPFATDRYAIDFNGWGFIGLGSSLLVQGCICSWCLLKSDIVPTWSSNPFTTALTCELLGLVQKDQINKSRKASTSTFIFPRKAPRRVDTKSTSKSASAHDFRIALAIPRCKQQAMRTEVTRCRFFTYYIWTVFAVLVLGILLNLIFSIRANSCTTTFVESSTHRVDFVGYWEAWCQVQVRYYSNTFFDRRDWAGLLIQCLVLSFISMGLHCAEMLTSITRDEAAWRKATTKGADASRGALMEGVRSWECWVMFAFKCLTPWMFGFAFVTNLYIFSTLIPLMVLAFMMLLLGVFAEYLVRRHPQGPQPSTFGNIAKLVALVDEWHPRMFWGDKGMLDHHIRKAGTAGQRLANVNMGTLYANLRV